MRSIKFMMLFLFAGWFQCFHAQQSKEIFTVKIEYLTYKPADYEKDAIKKWPLLIFLHGSGERGSDLEKVKVHGPPMLIEEGKQFPFMVISPQAGPRGWNTDLLYSMITDFIKNNRVDPDRVYLTGLSMGGRGTWELAQEHPELFAAIVPICGRANTSDAWKLRHMSVWCFHGEKDEIVPISTSRNMVRALENLNAPVKFTVYPEVYHDSWVKAYNDPKLYEWLLAQKKFRYKAIHVDQSILKGYTGKYHYKMQGDEGIFEVLMENDQLIIDLRSRKTPLIPYEKNKFFIQESQQVEFQFLQNDQGDVDRIMFYTNEINTFEKLRK